MVRIPSVGRSGRSAQRGASAALAAVMLVALMVSGMSVIEIGRFYYTQRELQRVADLAAMDAVRMASGCAAGVPDVMSANSASMDTAVRNAALASIAANRGSALSLAPLSGLTTTTTAGRSINDIDDSSAGANSFRYFNTLVTRPTADAVRVDLTATQPPMLTSFLPNANPVTMRATATARQINVGSWQVRTSLLDLNTANGFLGPLLGIANLNLSVASYQSLLNASLPAASVAAALGVPNPQGVGAGTLASVNLPLGTALNNLANALAASGQSAAAGALGQLAAASQATGTVNAGGIFAGTLGAISPAANLNAYDLLTSLAEDVTSAYPLTVPVNLTTLGALNAGVFVFLNGPQQPGFGPPGLDGSGNPLDTRNAQLSKSSSGIIQIRLTLLGNTGLLGSALNLLKLLGAVSVSNINIGVDVAFPAATGGLAGLTCPNASSLTYSYNLQTITQPITVTAGTFTGSIPSKPTNPAQVPTLGGGNLLSVTLLPLLGSGITANVASLTGPAVVQAGGSSQQTTIIPVSVPLQAGTLPIQMAAGSNNLDIVSAITSSLSTLLSSRLQVLPTVLGVAVPVQAVAGNLLALLTPPLNTVDSTLLSPVLNGIGLQLGASTEEVDALPATPSGLPPIVVTERTDSNDQFH